MRFFVSTFLLFERVGWHVEGSGRGSGSGSVMAFYVHV